MRIKSFLLAAALLATPSLALAQHQPTRAEQQRIDRILRQTPLIDGHNDLPWEIKSSFGNNLDAVDLDADTRQLTPPLHTDIPRLRQGRVGAQFWSVYVPASLKGLDATQATFEQIDLTRRMIARYPRAFEFADGADDIVRIHRAGRIASMFGMEGGEAINNNLALIREFRASGVLYMTLTHSLNTDWVDSATDAPRHGGLTPFGEDVIREMNRVGMLVDLSHVSAEAMRDALRVTSAPVIFSHSSAFAITPHPRNVPDDVLQLVRQNGGVVMVNFFPAFTSTEVWQWGARRAAEEARLKALNPADPAAVTAGVAEWIAANTRPQIDVGVIADHIEHIGRVAGRDHVGIGSDYDGVPWLPQGLEGVETYPNLFAELIRRGWSDADLAKLAGGNLLRALRAAERVAARD
ncbi:dipeptidase [Terricaulis sp.]|uniref:dipeptidase n=1 Tax=Terricaulis sp. TaxID=2768686 RepID=UPI002AC75BEC|nr:dipeptidase [Terricaulis sp.]MDZ4693284.1 dipeptidase [Terricaulis sp.]